MINIPRRAIRLPTTCPDLQNSSLELHVILLAFIQMIIRSVTLMILLALLRYTGMFKFIMIAKPPYRFCQARMFSSKHG